MGLAISNKKAILCECCGGCPGCCMPVDEFGTPVDIPFEVDAPGCTTDGVTGVFNPLALSDVTGSCGVCGVWGYDGLLEIQGSFWMFNGIDCDLVPGCTIQICMILDCDTEHDVPDDPGNAECCRRLRLYVATDYEFAGATDNGGTGQCVGKRWETYLGPSSCSCTDGVLSAIFDLGILNPVAKVDPECGTVQPCVPDCDMTGLRIII